MSSAAGSVGACAPAMQRLTLDPLRNGDNKACAEPWAQATATHWARIGEPARADLPPLRSFKVQLPEGTAFARSELAPVFRTRNGVYCASDVHVRANGHSHVRTGHGCA